MSEEVIVTSVADKVATMTFNSATLVPSPFSVPRGGGTYFTMYPDRNAGAMIEWAWGVSRIIDGLYKTTGHNIDVKRIAVTGCSYQGKMALYAGAFDDVVPHLSVPLLPDEEVADVEAELADRLPVSARAEEAALYWWEEGACGTLATFPFGTSAA